MHQFAHGSMRATVLGLAFGLGFAGSVTAQDFPAGVACGFPLKVQANGTPPAARVFTDKEGNPVKSIAAGKGVQLTFTNVVSGATF